MNLQAQVMGMGKLCNHAPDMGRGSILGMNGSLRLDASISGIAGLGHIAMGVSMMAMLLSVRRRAA